MKIQSVNSHVRIDSDAVPEILIDDELTVMTALLVDDIGNPVPNKGLLQIIVEDEKGVSDSHLGVLKERTEEISGTKTIMRIYFESPEMLYLLRDSIDHLIGSLTDVEGALENARRPKRLLN